MLRLSPLLILAVSLFCGCDGYIAFYDENVIDKCGGERYTSTEQICENDIMKRPCGYNYYDPKTQFCFSQDTKIYDKCGGWTYNPSNEKCNGIIVFIKCGDDYYYPESSTQFCFNDTLYDKCNGDSYYPPNQKCEDDILLTKCGDDYFYHSYSDPASTQFCVNDVLYDKCGGESYNISASVYCSNDSLVFDYGTLTDSRDNKTYRTIKIGNQIWMAENLRHEIPNAKCYDNNSDNCERIGIIYYWNDAKTICPFGWHLPSNAEWNALGNFVGSYAGIRLKAKSDLWSSGGGSDEFGFAALPGGYIAINDARIQAATFLSSTEAVDGGVSYYYISNEGQSLYVTHYYVDETLAYARCIED
jgi:uncharacterized protein (TIGR02145 family)